MSTHNIYVFYGELHQCNEDFRHQTLPTHTDQYQWPPLIAVGTI